MAMFDGNNATEVHFLPSVSEKKYWQKTYIIYATLFIQTALDLAVLDGLGSILVFSKNGYSLNNLAKKIQKN